MSAVHPQIAEAALKCQFVEDQKRLLPHLQALRYSSTFPDIFADTSMSVQQRREMDEDADAVLWPNAPKNVTWYDRILEMTRQQAEVGEVPLRWVFLMEHYIRQTMKCLKHGDLKLAIKYMGVYSHVIGDVAEPVHAICPEIIHQVIPTPDAFVGYDLHSGTENVMAPVDIVGYQPKRLGNTVQKAVMGAYVSLCECRQIGAAQMVPMAQATYAGDKESVIRHSSLAQNAAARAFADFIFTVLRLVDDVNHEAENQLDLRRYPWAHTHSDMLYGYQPVRDRSPIPYGMGKYEPLVVMDGGMEKPVQGLSMLPRLSPPFTSDRDRSVWVTYWLAPSAYQRFESRVASNPRFTDAMFPVRFTVELDDVPVFVSGDMGVDDSPQLISVALGNARWLTLKCNTVGNPTSEDVKRLSCAWAPHGVWADPKLIG